MASPCLFVQLAGRTANTAKGAFISPHWASVFFHTPPGGDVSGRQKGAPQRISCRCGAPLLLFAPAAYRAAGLLFCRKGREIHSRKLFVDAL